MTKSQSSESSSNKIQSNQGRNLTWKSKKAFAKYQTPNIKLQGLNPWSNDLQTGSCLGLKNQSETQHQFVMIRE